MGFEFAVLGSLEVRLDGVPVAINSAKMRALLASLLIDGNRVVAVEVLIARLWGESPPDGARNTLQNYVLRLRRTLGEARAGGPVLTQLQGYQIEVGDEALDLHRFERLSKQARSMVADGELKKASALLQEALQLWRAQPLLDVPSEQLQREIVPRLVEQWLDVVELNIDVELALGRHTSVLPELRELTSAHPMRERFWAQRMIALYRAGRQNEALECYRLVSGVLAEELGVDPGGELRQLHHQVLTGDAVLDSYDKRQKEELVPGNLPVELARFVGREEPLALAVQLLDSSRLVTLTGLAGIGKSRLALEVAAQRQSCFPDGVWVVDLAPVSAPGLVGEAMAEAVGAEAATCVERLKEKRALLVLDNCEHLVDGVAAAVTTLLRAAPDVRVLVTSRQRLGVLGEHVFRVPPLTDAEAVDLLVDRATAFASDFRADNPATLARLCRRLDGMALAVELAAARLSALSLEEVVERLDDRFRLLTDTGVRITRPSHRTLSRAIGSSYELCSEREKLLWARLSVFGCEFDLAAAETVGAGTGIEREDVVDLLSCLVHKSILVATVSGDKARYHLAEAVRLYGQERLYELGQEVEVRRRLHERVECSDQKAS